MLRIASQMPREIAARTKHRAMLFLPMTREVFGAEAGLALDADDERRHASGGRFRDIDRLERQVGIQTFNAALDAKTRLLVRGERPEETTSELQSIMRLPYAVFCSKKTKH